MSRYVLIASRLALLRVGWEIRYCLIYPSIAFSCHTLLFVFCKKILCVCRIWPLLLLLLHALSRPCLAIQRGPGPLVFGTNTSTVFANRHPVTPFYLSPGFAWCLPYCTTVLGTAVSTNTDPIPFPVAIDPPGSPLRARSTRAVLFLLPRPVPA